MTTRQTRVIVTTRLYPPEVAAAAFRVQAVVDALASADVDVEVFTTRPPGATQNGSRPGVRVRRWPALRDETGAIRGFAQYLSFDIPLAFRLLFSRADAFVAEAPPTTGMVTLVAAAVRRRPFFYYPGDVWTDGASSMGASALVVAILRRMERAVVRGAKAVLAVSPEVGDRLREIGGEGTTIVEVGNGIDTTVFTPDGPVATAAHPYFIYTGTMSEWQRPEVFVEALALIERTDVELRFFGQGTAVAAVRAAAERLVPGRVHIDDPLPAREVAPWLRTAVAAMVSIVPGIGYDFARPTKTYAAAAVGTPVLYAGAVTGARIVEDGALGEAVGFTAQEVASAMERLLAAAPDAVALRAPRVTWVLEHASLAAAGRRASQAVLGNGAFGVED